MPRGGGRSGIEGKGQSTFSRVLADGHVAVLRLERLVGDDADVLGAPPLRLDVAVEVAGGEVGECGHLQSSGKARRVLTCITVGQ